MNRIKAIATSARRRLRVAVDFAWDVIKWVIAILIADSISGG